MLASRVAVAGPTSNATRRVVGQWGGAGGACCEDHFAFCGELLGFARLETRLEKPVFFQLKKITTRRERSRDAPRLCLYGLLFDLTSYALLGGVSASRSKRAFRK